MASRIWVAFFQGEQHEIQAREQIISAVMNRESFSLSNAIMAIFDAGYEEWVEELGNPEVKEAWGLAKLELIAKKVIARQKVVSRALELVGEDAMVEEAVRGGMDEEEARMMVVESLGAVEGQRVESKSAKMQEWLRGYLGKRGITPALEVKDAAIEEGQISDQLLEMTRDWNLMCTVASQLGMRGKKRGFWEI